MVAAGFELIANESQAEHPAAESVLGVVGDCLAVNRFLRGHRLVYHGDAKLDGCLDLSRMKGCIPAAELDGSPKEKCVKVRQDVPAVVVFPCAAVFGIPVVPNIGKLLQGFGLLLVELLEETLVGFLAVADAPLVHLDGIVKQILFRCEKVHQIPECLRRHALHGNVDVHPLVGGVGEGSRRAELADDFLKLLDVIVAKDRSDELHPVLIRCGNRAPTHLLLGANARIAHYFPDPILVISDFVGVVGAADVAVLGAKVLGDGFRRLFPRDARHFDFDAKPCVSGHFENPLSLSAVWLRVFLRYCINHSFENYYQVNNSIIRKYTQTQSGADCISSRGIFGYSSLGISPVMMKCT